MFQPVDPIPNFPNIESKILDFWKKNKTFEKSVTSRHEDKRWTFLDGPPFITGLPHYGSLLSSIPKDVFPRFWTMKGYRVRRVWGWDCHGLPAENKVETKLGIIRKKDIEEKIGVKKFIDECKNYVSEVSSEWEWYIDHIARWVDFKNAYKTMDTPYMESVMWVFKSMYDKGYIYKGRRISLYCPHCVTPISNFEVAMDDDNYKDITEEATYYKYEVVGEKNTYFLAWSTTPWNKLVTTALAINPKLTYVKIKQSDEYYILAKSTLKNLKKEPYTIISAFKGEELVGKEYIPHFTFYKIDQNKKAFKIHGADFVTADEGTGIVTIAPYGEDDLRLMEKDTIHIELHVDEEGILKKYVPKFGGLYYLKADKEINKDLESRGLIYLNQQHTHSVAHCWRCHTRLYYAPQDAWYVNIQKLKPLLKKTNKTTQWIPNHFKNGRFLKSMEAAPDWCISRSRYWGSPVPVWECPNGHRFVPGSIEELRKKSGKEIKDLHKPDIDEVTVSCDECGEISRRVPEVLDSWIEAGSASFAERHFPFNKEEKLENFFPPDFITEYTGQIRAWFYVVHVIATSLYQSPGFKNVLVTGVVLGSDGRKMSKNYGNYPDPKLMLTKYGADALRLYLLGSPVMSGNDILISEEEYRSQIRDIQLVLWNSYKFFVLYAQEKGFKPNNKTSQKNILDKWIIERLDEFTNQITQNLEKYQTRESVRDIKLFINDLSTWYIRRSRERFAQNDEDAFITLYNVLVRLCKLIAPITPFISEEIYKNLTDEESVHLTDWPTTTIPETDRELIDSMEEVRKIVEIGHSIRKINTIKVRQPLTSVTVFNTTISKKFQESLTTLISDELNVKKIFWSTKGKGLSVELDTKITDELREEGNARDIVRAIQQLRKEAKFSLHDQIVVRLPEFPLAYEEYIKEKTLAKKLIQSSKLSIEKI